MVAIEEGPPSLEVAHLWGGRAYLNDRFTESGARNWNPHVRLDDIAVTLETPDTVEANQGRRGSYAYPTSVKSATYEYEGRLVAQTLPGLRKLEGGLRSAFRDRQTVGTMVLLGEPSWFFSARIMDLDIPKKMIGGPDRLWPWAMSFGLTLRLLDPRVYLLVPAAAAGAADASVPVENEGMIDTDPTFTFDGFPGGDLVGRNETLNVGLRFRDLPAGDVVLEFSKRKLTVDGVDRTARLDPESTWWDENEQGLIAGAQAIRWSHAWTAVWFLGADA